MIKTLSPYYLSIPFVSTNTGLTCENYEVSVFVWNGLKASVPASATYTLTKDNPTGSTGTDETVEISKLISDYIEFAPQSNGATALINGNNQWWVQTSVTYTTTDPADATTPQEVETNLFSLGYSWGFEGKNVTTIADDILLTGREFKVDRNGWFILPVLLSESLTKTGSVISYPDNQINLAISEAATTTSSELVQYIWVQIDETTTDSYIEIDYEGEITTLLINDEYKYTPVDVFFQNKEGALQSFTFRKERRDSMTSTKSTYESDSGQPADGFHQFKDYNVQGKSSFSLNTGFIPEANNETIRQLLLTERCWTFDGTNYTPINVKTSSREMKTQTNDKLINYKIDFDYSYNEINDI